MRRVDELVGGDAARTRRERRDSAGSTGVPDLPRGTVPPRAQEGVFRGPTDVEAGLVLQLQLLWSETRSESKQNG